MRRGRDAPAGGAGGAEITMVIRPRTVVVAAACAGVVVMALSVIAVVADELLGVTMLGRLDGDTEGSIPAWYQSLLLAASALLWLVFAVRERRAQRSWVAWIVLAAVFAAASIDEIVAAHEELIDPLREAFGTSGVLHFAWVIPGAAFALVLAAAVARPVLRLAGPARTLVIGAGAMYLAGAIGVEGVGGLVASGNGEATLLYRGITQVEEVLETAAAVVLLAGLLRLLAPLHAFATDETTSPRLVEPVGAPVVRRQLDAAALSAAVLMLAVAALTFL